MNKEFKILAEFNYKLPKIEKGYTNQTLYINLTNNKIEKKPVTQKMKDIFIGGKGFDLWLLWHGIKDTTKWNDPENEICISSGPLGGTTYYSGSGKSIVTTISPLTDIVIDSNVGGHFGPFLKFSGWDALEIQGKAEKDVIIFIDGTKSKVQILQAFIEDYNSHVIAEELTEYFKDSEENKRDISVVSTGIGSDNTLIGCLNFSWYDPKRKKVRLKQAGRGGIGTVFRDKKIVALVCKFHGVNAKINNPVDYERVQKYGKKLAQEILEHDHEQCRMREVGTSNIADVMNDYDLIPVHNFKFGSHHDFNKISSKVFKEKYFTQGMFDGCWYGCTLSCCKAVENFELKTGPYKGKKVIVDGPEYETLAGCGTNPGIFDPEFIIEANFYCDTYGIDTISFGTLLSFIMECYELGIINKEHTGGLELKFGGKDAALELIHQMAKGTGFGKIAGLGIRKMKKIFIEKYGADPNILQDIGMEAKGLEYSEYVSKESLAQQGGYGLALKGPQHDEAWLIFLDMVNNQMPTFEEKAEALHWFPMFRTWFGLVGLCKLPWNDIQPPENKMSKEPAKIPAHVEGYINYFSGVTGREIDENKLIEMSEAVYNFQKVFNLRMGVGTREHDNIPYRSMGPVTKEEYESRADRYDKQLKEIIKINPEGKSTEEKMKILREYREKEYEKLKDAVYKRRGWTSNGIPTLETLKRLRIDFPEVVEVVKKYL